jgi:hypothetical protein
MKKYILLITILLINYCAKSQIYASNYEKGYKEGFKQGYCYNKTPMSVCSYPVIVYPPIPKINESSDNYTQGYNRGFENGLGLKRSKDAINEVDMNLNRRILKFNEYISQNPVSAMAAVGMKMQAKYDARKDWIQNRINVLAELLNQIFDNQTLPNNINPISIKERIWKEAVNYVNTIRGVDYANDYQFNTIQNRFNKIENNFYESYNEMVSQNSEKERMANSNKNAIGKISFYTNWKNSSKMKVYLEGSYIGTFNSYFPDEQPNCGQDGTITVSREPGTYNFSARGEGTFSSYTWKGSITITAGACELQGLFKK